MMSSSTRSVAGLCACLFRFLPSRRVVSTAAFFVGASAFAAAPSITSFTPSTARYGATVTITGAGFTGATDVRINNVAGSATYVVDSDTQITATVAVVPAQSGAISVVGTGGTATSTAVFTIDAPAWSLQNPKPVAAFIENVTYGAGLYVATTSGNPGLILTSPDGAAWTVSYSHTAGLRAVTYANSLFVATGDGGSILTSTNGLTWTVRSSGTNQSLYGIAYGAGTFVALGNSSVVLTSTDAVTWTTQTLGTASISFQGAAFGAKLFAGVATSGRIFTSPDGITWTSQTSGTTNQLNEIIYANGKFLAVGNSSTAVTSTDGVTWALTTISGNSNYVGVTYGAGKFVAASFGTLATSADGVTWTTSSADLDVRGLTYANNQFVGVGYPGQVFTSPTAASASTFTLQTGFTRVAFSDAVYGNGRYLLVGANGSVVRSTDLAQWSLTPTVAGRTNALTHVAYGAGRYAAVSTSGLFTSTDGVTWSIGNATSLTSIVYNAGTWVATGTSTVVKSTDGLTWTNVTPTGFGPISSTGLAYGAGKYVAVGATGKIFYSTDAVTWTAATSNTANNLNNVRYGSGLFVAVGASSTLLTSPDGITWTAATAPSGAGSIPLGDVAIADGLFIVSGTTSSSSALWVSTNGTTWNSVLVGVNVLQQSGGYSGLAYGNGRFFLGSGGGLIATTQPLSDSLRITTQPAGKTIATDEVVNLTVAASGPSGITYQWYSGTSGDTRTPIAGATTASYTTPALAGSARYWVRVTAPSGVTVDSAQADLLGAPSILQQPAATVTTVDGVTSALSVQVIGPGPFSYQWQHDGVDILGAVSSSYIIGSGAGAAGNYRVVVSNALGSITSSVAAVTVSVTAPAVTTVTITANATATTAATASADAGTNADFQVSATGTGPFTYQWNFKGTPLADASGKISGATANILRVKDVQDADAGAYTCVVTNAAGSATSSAATLTVSDSVPKIVDQSAIFDVTTVEGDSSVSFSVTAKGTGPLVYQWMRGTTAIPGATSPNYDLGPLTVAQSGSYTCVISNPNAPSNVGTVTTNAATVTVTASVPVITVQPNQFIPIVGANATDSVVVIGTPPFTYQWKKDGVAIAGATSATLFLPAVDSTAGGAYTVEISNSLSTTPTVSQPANLILGNPSVVKSVLPLPHDGPLAAVAYGAGKFVAVGLSGQIRTSTDGVTWTGQPIVGNYAYEQIIFANNQFILVGYVQVFGTSQSLGVILTSPDGITWTQRVGTMQFPVLHGVTFDAGIYVAVGDDGTLLTSPDAITWTQRTTPFPVGATIYRVAYGAGRFVAVGDGGAATSTDGVTWTSVSALRKDSTFFSAIVYANNQFVLGTSGSVFATSSDGLAWTQGTANVSTEDGGSGGINRIIYNGGTYYAPTTFGTVATSTDGAHWVFRRTTAASIGLNDLALGGGTYVAVGNSGEVLTSTDGLAWTSRRNSSLPATNYTGIASSPTREVVVGLGGLIGASSDGVAWTQRTSGVTSDLEAVTYGGGRFVAVGLGGTVVTSTDGLYWNQLVLPGTPAPSLFGVTYDGTNYIAVGNGGNIWYSADAATWTKVTGLPTWALRAVTASGGTVTAVGTASVIATASSSNLSSWTLRTFTPAVSLTLRSVAAGGGKFLTGGIDANSRTVFVSSADGVTWTSVRTPYSSSVNGLVYANGHFSTASGSSAVLSSTDGVIWTSEFSGTTNRQAAIAYTPNGYISVGDAGSMRAFSASLPPSVTGVVPATPLSGTDVVITGSNFTGATGVSFNGLAATTFTVNSDTQITATIPLAATAGVVTVTSPGGTSIATAGATLALVTATAPSITTQPASANVLPGASVSFTVAASAAPAPTYQWYFGTSALSGATTATYTIASVSAADSGSYTCVVTNSLGSVTSSAAVLGVKPAITAQPSSASVIEASNASFTVVATGTAPLSYVWRKDGNVISGATGATLSLSSVALTAAGNYTVDVTNAYGSVTSSTVSLSIAALVTPPSITTHPVSLTVNPGATATFSVEASGTAPFTYVWKKGTSVISSATAATLTLTNVTAADAGSYSVIVSNSANSATSNAATLTVNVPVTVSALTGKTVTAGDSASFTVTASGTAPFAYQWAKNGTALSGQTSATLTLASTATTDTGRYTCTVTNIAGSASASATLTVNPAIFPPAISSASTAAVAINSSFTYQIVASNSPTSYAASPLPAGLTINAATGLISGASSAAGTTTVNLSATNAGGTGTATLALTIVQPVPVVISASRATGRIGDPFTYTITGTNLPTSFAATGLPAGLTLNTSTGVISGTPTGTAGTATVSLTASNTAGTSPTYGLTLTVLPALNASVITSAPLATARIGDPFTYQITANNAPTGYTLVSAPAGITLNAANGVVSGTWPATASTVTLQIAASNAAGAGPTFNVTVQVSPALTAPVITSSTSATATIGTAFSYSIFATNTPTSFALTAGTLPAGLSFNAATGQITGTPTAQETQVLTLAASNASGTGSATVTITVVAGASAPAVTSSNLASGRVGVTFTYTIVASNAPTAFSASNLPAGLTLNPTTGLIAGTPTSAGTFNVLLGASNAAGPGAPFTLALTITPAATAPVVTSLATASGTAGTLFTYQIAATNGPLTSYAAYGLPTDLALNPLTGVITGTPSTAAISNVYVTASNAVGTSAPLNLLINIAPSAQAPVITSSQSASGTQGTAFADYTITATNTPTSYAASGLPAGLAVNPNTGLIGGTPTVSGSFTVTLTASNAAATSSGRALIITIDPSAAAPAITSGTSAAAFAGTAFTSYTITATNTPTSFDASGRPGWLTVNTATGALGGTPVVPGVYTVQLKASNATGSSAPSPLAITVSPAVGSPIVNSPLGKSGRANDAFSYQITANSAGPITGYSASGLPGGLSLDPTSGLITGTPSVPGTYQVEIGATNAIGIGGTKTLVVTLAAAPGSPIIGGSSSGSGLVGALSVGSRRVFTSGALASLATIESSATVGVPYSYQIGASGNPTTFSADGLPAGLAVNPGTGLISGAPAEAGVFEIEIRASNDIGVGASATLVLTVAPPATTPSMTSAFTASGTAGAAFTFTGAASNSPTSFNAAGLPAGLSLNAATGVISGTPTAPGTYAVKLSANNAIGTGPITTVTFTIAAAAGAPAVTSAATASGTVDTAFSYTVAASNSPTSYAAAGLPPGLVIDATSGAITGTPATSGEFIISLTARNAVGLSTPFKLTLTIVPPGNTPTITSPASASVTIGTSFAYATTATNSPSSYNITNLPDGLSANSTTGLIDGVPSTIGTYSIKISANNDSGTGAPLTLTLEVLPVGGTPGTPGGVGGSRLINLSTRGVVGTGDKVLIAGFVITGSEPKPVMIRAVGPGLVAQGVTGELKDPTLELVKGVVTLSSNDDWGSGGNAATIAATATRVGAFALTNGSAEAVIVTTLAPGVYSAVARGKGSATGVALIEVYDTSEALPVSAPRLVNLSARGDVGTGGNILFGGFVITGDTPRQVLLRAVGPGLTPLGVSGALADPKLQVFRGGVVVNENDNWGSAGDAATVAATASTVGAFALTNGSKDAVILTTLPPGAYTMQVSGVGATTGVAMVEIYEVP